MVLKFSFCFSVFKFSLLFTFMSLYHGFVLLYLIDFNMKCVMNHFSLHIHIYSHILPTYVYIYVYHVCILHVCHVCIWYVDTWYMTYKYENVLLWVICYSICYTKTFTTFKTHLSFHEVQGMKQNILNLSKNYFWKNKKCLSCSKVKIPFLGSIADTSLWKHTFLSSVLYIIIRVI